MRDPFELLGLPAAFALEDEAVQQAYLSRVAAVHPDLAAQDPERAGEAARTAAALNQAREVLLDPERRARVLLERRGVPESRDLPAGFLMEIMETRLAIEEASKARDAAEIARWRDWAGSARREYVDRLGVLFGELEASEPARSLGGEIRMQLNAWRYIERLIEQLPAAD